MTTGSPPALRVTDNPDRKRFEGYLDDELVGIVEYIPLSGKIIATHTEVLEAFEGRGIGSQLAEGVLQQLRTDGRLVQPLCPYLSAYLQRHPEWSDVVDRTTPH